MIRKKILLLILMFLLTSPILVACKPNNNNNNTNNNSSNNANNNPQATSINISYIKDLTMDIGSSTAFGIKKVTVNQTAPIVANSCGVSLLSATLASNDEIIEKNYLYSTTETYENGDVEYNENSITKVTFKKNVLIEEDIFDSQGNLIDSNKTVTQEEIPAQINKLYVNEKYIFMQFVALVKGSGNYNYYDNDELKTEYIELRPNDLTFFPSVKCLNDVHPQNASSPICSTECGRTTLLNFA